MRRSIAAGHRALGQLEQVVARTEHYGLDAAPARLLDQVEAFDLAAAGPGVHEQHRTHRGSHAGARGGAALQRREVASQPMTGRPCGHGDQRNQEQQLQQLAVGHHQCQRHGQGQDRHHRRDQPAYAGPGEDVGARADRHSQTRDRHHQHQRALEEANHGNRQHGNHRDQGHDRAQPACWAHRLHLRPPS
jgi:hypothetical protein